MRIQCGHAQTGFDLVQCALGAQCGHALNHLQCCILAFSHVGLSLQFTVHKMQWSVQVTMNIYHVFSLWRSGSTGPRKSMYDTRPSLGACIEGVVWGRASSLATRPDCSRACFTARSFYWLPTSTWCLQVFEIVAMHVLFLPVLIQCSSGLDSTEASTL